MIGHKDTINQMIENEDDPMAVSKEDVAPRKKFPMFSGLLMYFPDALKEVSHCSWIGNEQHNPGEHLHWDRPKSGDEKDALVRHLMESGTIDDDGVRHSVKVAWRALASLQKELEKAGAAPLSKYNEL